MRKRIILHRVMTLPMPTATGTEIDTEINRRINVEVARIIENIKNEREEFYLTNIEIMDVSYIFTALRTVMLCTLKIVATGELINPGPEDYYTRFTPYGPVRSDD